MIDINLILALGSLIIAANVTLVVYWALKRRELKRNGKL